MPSLRDGLLCAAFLLGTMALPAQGTPQIPALILVGELPVTAVQDGFDGKKIHLQQSLSTGQTTRTYVNSGAWDRILGQLHPGDLVVLDFGSDNLPAQDKNDAARTLAGFGDGTFDYLDPGTKKVELVHSYGWYLRRMVVDVINHGGVPMLCAGPANPANPGAADWARYIATEQRVTLVPLTADGQGFVSGLQTLTPDPLAPYLKGSS